jgi:hypothetical protein
VAPKSDLIDSAAEGTDGRGADAHDTISAVTAMSAGFHGAVDLRFKPDYCLLPAAAVATASKALTLQLHCVPYAGDAANPARDPFGTIQRIRCPDITAQLHHAVIDARRWM